MDCVPFKTSRRLLWSWYLGQPFNRYWTLRPADNFDPNSVVYKFACGGQGRLEKDGLSRLRGRSFPLYAGNRIRNRREKTTQVPLS